MVVTELVAVTDFVDVGVWTRQLHAGDMIEAAIVEKMPCYISAEMMHRISA